jgi:hypothetical protein
MNTTVNDDPLGTAWQDRRVKQALSARNPGAGRYGNADPDVWGWRRPEPAELVAERIAELEQVLADAGTQE